MAYISFGRFCQENTEHNPEEEKFETIVESIHNRLWNKWHKKNEDLKDEALIELKKNPDFVRIIALKELTEDKVKELEKLKSFEFQKRARLQNDIKIMNDEASKIALKILPTYYGTDAKNKAHFIYWDALSYYQNKATSNLEDCLDKIDIKARLYLMEGWEQLDFNTLLSKFDNE